MSDDAPFILCRGGRGGWGNQHFRHPHQAGPRFAKAAIPARARGGAGAEAAGRCGLVASPTWVSPRCSAWSAGLSQDRQLSLHHPFPQPGVVYVEEGVSFVMADIPGIIEAPPTAPDWATTFCATSTAAACSSMWWTSLAARAGTRWRTSRPSTPS